MQPPHDPSGPDHYDAPSPPPQHQHQQQARNASAMRGPLLYGGNASPAGNGNGHGGVPADIDAARSRRLAIEERLAALQVCVRRGE